MDIQTLSALALFAFAATFSPGPNNIMLLTSGANVGFLRTIPHMAGIMVGFFVMVMVVGTGIVVVLEQYPILNQALQFVCLSYLFYLAYKIATAPVELDTNIDYQPMSFFAAAWFQWVNPKAWSISLSAVGAYNASGSWSTLVLIGGVFALVTIPSVSIWTATGKQLGKILGQANRIRWFNLSMAALLVISVLMTL
ncbi:LysE family translocator [Vibrio sp. SCSIO 43136]|uniref:LysE family translocator n=1 Tax=Vibrio sp. SCSIO 43136 TaxID=2819101 RepID=UPI00207511BD|nr:LysE family translocator [Vibrio sp. SCSIO 43136]USD64682.1 LysE family translocator [Vibrio sp. SCSIO 43136]